MVDRTLGTVGFSVAGKYKEAFKDEEIKTGELHFACSARSKGNGFKIEKIK